MVMNYGVHETQFKNMNFGPVTQLDRVPGFGLGCRGFKSLQARLPYFNFY